MHNTDIYAVSLKLSYMFLCIYDAHICHIYVAYMTSVHICIIYKNSTPCIYELTNIFVSYLLHI